MEGGSELDDATIEFAHRMFDLARQGDPELLAVIDAGLPVDLTDAKGNTLLMLAAYHGRAEVTIGLLERGADPERVNDRGQRPLAGAVFTGAPDVVAALLAAGADPRAGAPTAIDTALMFERTEILAMLEGRG